MFPSAPQRPVGHLRLPSQGLLISSAPLRPVGQRRFRLQVCKLLPAAGRSTLLALGKIVARFLSLRGCDRKGSSARWAIRLGLPEVSRRNVLRSIPRFPACAALGHGRGSALADCAWKRTPCGRRGPKSRRLGHEHRTDPNRRQAEPISRRCGIPAPVYLEFGYELMNLSLRRAR